MTVLAVQGRPEYLWEISLRVLGDRQRYLEIFELNRGRVEPGGGTFADPALLHVGWILVLPWDASGPDVRYGPLPVIAPASPQPATTTARLGPAARDVDLICAVPPKRTILGIPWAQLRLTPETAWTRAEGAGVDVAVIDSGVDPTVPALAGRVLAGANATDSAVRTPRGDQDCSGHGTAMAGILAAAARPDTEFVGMAPAVTVYPIKITIAGGVADSGQVVAALRMAVAVHVRVAMIGANVDTTDVGVTAALRTAAAADIVLVLAAPAPTMAPGPKLPEGVLRVGAVGPDEHLAEAYPSGSVDVVAPGVDVVALGIGGSGEVQGSGTGYAVPFVAGVAALLRSSEPRLTAAEAAARVMGTADGAADLKAPDPWFGWGMVNPAAALSADPPRTSRTFQPAPGSGAVTVFVAVLAVAGLALGLRRRR